MIDESLTRQLDADTTADAPLEWIDVLKSRGQRPVVRIKRRRQAPAPGEGAEQSDAPTTHVGHERPPRTFRLASPVVDRDRQANADRDRDAVADSSGAETSVSTGASTTPRLRPTYRRHPSRLPGVVSRTVFSSSGSTLLESAASTSDEAAVIGRIAIKSSPFYEVMRALERLQTTLEDIRRLSQYEFL